jgi:hypothetical protein
MGFFTATIHVVNDVTYVILLCCRYVCKRRNNGILQKHKKHEGFAIPPVYQFEHVALAIRQES